jgi:hypothetical protein
MQWLRGARTWAWSWPPDELEIEYAPSALASHFSRELKHWPPTSFGYNLRRIPDSKRDELVYFCTHYVLLFTDWQR